MPIVNGVQYAPVPTCDKEASVVTLGVPAAPAAAAQQQKGCKKRCKRLCKRVCVALLLVVGLAVGAGLLVHKLSHHHGHHQHHSGHHDNKPVCSYPKVSAFDGAIFLPFEDQCVMMVKIGDNFFRLMSANNVQYDELVERAKNCPYKNKPWQELLAKKMASLAGAKDSHYINLLLERDVGVLVDVAAVQTKAKHHGVEKHWGVEGCDGLTVRTGYTVAPVVNGQQQMPYMPVGGDVDVDYAEQEVDVMDVVDVGAEEDVDMSDDAMIDGVEKLHDLVRKPIDKMLPQDLAEGSGKMTKEMAMRLAQQIHDQRIEADSDNTEMPEHHDKKHHDNEEHHDKEHHKEEHHDNEHDKKEEHHKKEKEEHHKKEKEEHHKKEKEHHKKEKEHHKEHDKKEHHKEEHHKEHDKNERRDRH